MAWQHCVRFKTRRKTEKQTYTVLKRMNKSGQRWDGMGKRKEEIKKKKKNNTKNEPYNR